MPLRSADWSWFLFDARTGTVEKLWKKAVAAQRKTAYGHIRIEDSVHISAYAAHQELARTLAAFARGKADAGVRDRSTTTALFQGHDVCRRSLSRQDKFYIELLAEVCVSCADHGDAVRLDNILGMAVRLALHSLGPSSAALERLTQCPQRATETGSLRAQRRIDRAEGRWQVRQRRRGSADAATIEAAWELIDTAAQAYDVRTVHTVILLMLVELRSELGDDHTITRRFALMGGDRLLDVGLVEEGLALSARYYQRHPVDPDALPVRASEPVAEPAAQAMTDVDMAVHLQLLGRADEAGQVVRSALDVVADVRELASTPGDRYLLDAVSHVGSFHFGSAFARRGRWEPARNAFHDAYTGLQDGFLGRFAQLYGNAATYAWRQQQRS